MIHLIERYFIKIANRDEEKPPKHRQLSNITWHLDEDNISTNKVEYDSIVFKKVSD